jgi:hypothetical protein
MLRIEIPKVIESRLAKPKWFISRTSVPVADIPIDDVGIELGTLPHALETSCQRQGVSIKPMQASYWSSRRKNTP